jgi:hypothetical protein
LGADESPQASATPSRCSKLVDFYCGLSPRSRVGLWILLGIEAVLIVVTQRDIQRRPAANIRGPKLLWRAIATQNVIGPALYFTIGRRSSGSAAEPADPTEEPATRD